MTSLFKDSSQEISLKPLQEIALESCRDVFRYGTKRFILKATCGFGKTVLGAYFIQKAVQKGIRCLFVVDRIVLAEQTSQTFSRYGIHHGIIQASNPFYFPDRQVQIGSVQTLNRRKVHDYGLIIIDEAHCHYEGHKKLLKKNKDAFVIGLTSTPYSSGLGKYYETFIEPVTVKDMVEQKELVPFDIYGPDITDLSKLKIRAGEYTEESLSEAFDSVDIIGNVFNEWNKIARNKKTIIFGVNVAHIKHISKQFNRHGIKSCQINAYQTETERKDAVDGFLHGDTKVLCSVEVATKGFDCAAVDCVVLAVATKSHIKWEQTCGRGYRVFPGKEKCIILDMGGNAERLGFPDDYEFIELDDGKHNKSKNKNVEKPERLPKKCPSCEFIKPAGVHKCPACGFKPEYIQDVEAEEASLKKLQRKAKKEYTLIEKQSFLSQLNQFASEKGFKEGKNGCYGWSLHQYKEKFGSEPSSRLNWGKKEPVGDEVKKWIKHCFIKKAKSKAPEKCFTCRGEQFKIEQAGPHRKLSCAKCGRYIKFVNESQESDLRSKKQII